jgi:hypothetical protein
MTGTFWKQVIGAHLSSRGSDINEVRMSAILMIGDKVKNLR